MRMYQYLPRLLPILGLTLRSAAPGRISLPHINQTTSWRAIIIARGPLHLVLIAALV